MTLGSQSARLLRPERFDSLGGPAASATSPSTGGELQTALLALLAAAGAALSAAALAVGLAAPPASDRALVAVIHALLIATPVAVGVYGLTRDAQSRFSRVLVAAGFLWSPILLASSDQSVPYSIGRITGWIVVLSLVALVLMFPTGRLTGRVDRGLVITACLAVAVLYLPTVPLVKDYPVPNPFSACQHDCPHNAFAVTDSDPHFVHSVVEPVREVMSILLLLGAAAVLAGRMARASKVTRRTLNPALIGAIVALTATAAFLVVRRADQWSSSARTLGFIALLAIPGLVTGFLIGLLRWRFAATSALRRLADEFGGASDGAHVRDLIAEAIGDPSLEIAYWTGEPGHWVDETGVRVSLPRDDPTRAVTDITSRGEPVAALVHDPAHVGEPTVREVAGGFALMALENRRLDAELHASLRELHESRARILSAVDLERERIERDLHDGAQQRLVALRVALQVAGETLAHNPEAAGELLANLGANVEATLEEVRSLARGVYPPLLADHGIGDALRMAARGSSLPTTVRSHRIGRYSHQIESAVYFCCLEALQNAAKHSGARSATVLLSEDGELRFEVHDDGHGFRGAPVGGMGVDNMRDRIAALGGRLTIESPPGQGTTVIGTVPLGLTQLAPDVEMLFERATDALDDCFAIYRAVRDSRGTLIDFAVEHVNDAACRDAGRSREAQVGRMLSYLDSGYLDSELFAWHRQALEADGPSSLDEVFYERRALGRRLRKAYEVRAVPLGGGRLAVTWREITERKRKEDELLLQSTVLDRAAEGVCLVRAADGVIVYANPRFAKIYGYEPGELDGRHLAELNWEDEPGDAERKTRTILAELDEHGEASYELRNRRKDGSLIWSDAHIAAFEHPDHGKVWVTVQQDVTARKNAEEAVRLSEERVRMAARVAPLVLYTMDRTLRYTWVFNNQVGLEGDEHAVGRSDEELFGEDVARVLDEINGRALAGTPVRREVELDLTRGRSTFEIAVGPLRNARGYVVGIAGAAYDVSHRGLAERLKEMVERSPVGMGTVAADLRFLDTNPAFCSFVGYGPEALAEMTLADVVHPDDLVDVVEQALTEGRLAGGRLTRFITRTGRVATAALVGYRLEGRAEPERAPLAFILHGPELLERRAAPARFGRRLERR